MPITNDDRYEAAMAAMQTEESMAEQQRGVLDAMHQKAKANHAAKMAGHAGKAAGKAKATAAPDQATPDGGTPPQATVPPPYPV